MSFLVTIEFCAVTVSAIYGILLAARQGMDVVGVFVVACAAAFGGGTLRDVFLDRHPLFWITNSHYVLVVFGLAMVSGLIIRYLPRIRPLLPLPDAVGMALFTMVGAQIALESGTTWYIAALFGVMTGTFGGVIGDVICNEIPTLFRPAPLCATCALAGALVYLGLLHVGVAEPAAMLTGATVVVVFRLAALKWNWSFRGVRHPPV
ncbi:MAG: trimeric intracellular cation channel family protein [Verrucomicrobiaceae bacterium]